jgi:Na+/H+ antiporter NhaC
LQQSIYNLSSKYLKISTSDANSITFRRLFPLRTKIIICSNTLEQIDNFINLGNYVIHLHYAKDELPQYLLYNVWYLK